MKLIIVLLVFLMSSVCFAEQRVLTQYLHVSGDSVPISPTHVATVAAGVDAYSAGFNVTKSEFQSISIKGTLGTATEIKWCIEATNEDADGNDYWQVCTSIVTETADFDKLLALSLPVNAVFRVKLIADAADDYTISILSINRK